MKASKNVARERYLVALLVVSCLYKFSVVRGGILERFFERFINRLPLSEISRYTNTISIVKVFSLGLGLHIALAVYWLAVRKWKICIPRSLAARSLLLMLLVRFSSELIFNGNVNYYTLGFNILSLFVLFPFYEIQRDSASFESVKAALAKCFFVMGTLCAVFALVYYVVGLRQTIGIFSFRVFRIGGFLFDSIASGFLYGIALLSGFEMHRQKKLNVIVLYSAAAFLLIGCLLTGSRSAFYFIIIAVWYYLRSKRGVLKFGVLLLFTAIGFYLYTRVLNTFDKSFVSDDARGYKIQLAISVFKSQPIWGVGTNMFRNYDAIYGSNPHNLPLTFLSENGIIGFIVYLFWLLSTACNAIRTRDHYYRYFYYSFVLLSMIYGVLSNIITILFMVIATWGCDPMSRPRTNEIVVFESADGSLSPGEQWS